MSAAQAQWPSPIPAYTYLEAMAQEKKNRLPRHQWAVDVGNGSSNYKRSIRCLSRKEPE